MGKPSLEFLRDLLFKLIEIPTVNPPGNKYREFAEFSSSLLKSAGLEVEIHEVPEDYVVKHYPWAKGKPRFVVIGRKCWGGGGPTLHLNGHYDVVPPGHGWTVTEPFKPVEIDGKIYGRGAVDMKGGIASIIAAVKDLATIREELNGCVEVSLTPDEEVGGVTGVKWMLDEGLVRPDYAVVTEPSGADTVWIGNKGNVWGYVKVYGKQAHGSTPWLGVNAFECMVFVAQEMLKKLKTLVERRYSNYPFEVPEGRKATITLGGEVKGGAKINVVPGQYSFSFDRRLIPEERVNEVVSEIKGFLDEVSREVERLGCRVELEIVSMSEPAVLSEDSEFLKTVERVIVRHLGKEPCKYVCIGGLDTRYFLERGIQAVTYGPGPGKVAHMADEYVELEQVVKVSEVLKDLALSVLR